MERFLNHIFYSYYQLTKWIDPPRHINGKTIPNPIIAMYWFTLTIFLYEVAFSCLIACLLKFCGVAISDFIKQDYVTWPIGIIWVVGMIVCTQYFLCKDDKYEKYFAEFDKQPSEFRQVSIVVSLIIFLMGFYSIWLAVKILNL